MKICSEVALEKWTPNFSSSGQANPIWTRSHFDSVELFNALEYIVWAANPVQVVLCDACGYEGCAVVGYVHLSYLDGFVLWTTPQIDSADDWETTQYATAWPLNRFGALAIPQVVWDEWRVLAPLPEGRSLAPPNGAVIADAWYLGHGRPTQLRELVPMLKERLLGCDTLSPDDAIGRVEREVQRLLDPSASYIGATLRSPSALGARVETLYLDGRSDEDWPAFAVHNEVTYLLLDRENALVPVSRDA